PIPNPQPAQKEERRPTPQNDLLRANIESTGKVASSSVKPIPNPQPAQKEERRPTPQNDLLRANIEPARKLAREGHIEPARKVISNSANSMNEYYAKRREMQIRGPYGWYGDYYSDWQKILSDQTLLSALSYLQSHNFAEFLLIQKEFNKLEMMNLSLGNIKNELNNMFHTDIGPVQEERFSTQNELLKQEESQLTSLEQNYINELTTANTQIGSATLFSWAGSIFVKIPGGGEAPGIFLGSLGYKPVSTPISSSPEVELPGVPSAGSSLLPGMKIFGVTYGFHPNQFNQILSTANQATQLYNTINNEINAINSYVNLNNKMVNTYNNLIQNLSFFGAFGQQGPTQADLTNIMSRKANFPQLSINPAQPSTSQIPFPAISISPSFQTNIPTSTKATAQNQNANTIQNIENTLINKEESQKGASTTQTSTSTSTKSTTQNNNIIQNIENAVENIGKAIENVKTPKNYLNTELTAKNYVITPAGAFTVNGLLEVLPNGQIVEGLKTPKKLTGITAAEQKDIEEGKYIQEITVPWQAQLDVWILQSELAEENGAKNYYSNLLSGLNNFDASSIPANLQKTFPGLSAITTVKNVMASTEAIENANEQIALPAAENFGVGMLSSLGGIVSNPAIAERAYGPFSSQFLTQLGESGAQVGLMVATVGG
ncbi:MAG: hypothetical protein ACP5MB_11080, partial [bacterium]